MPTIRWGIIGCGNVTEVKSGPGFSKADNSRLVAVMRRDAALAEDYARRHNVPRAYSRAADLINDPEVDAVYIATPPGSHESLALEVLAADKPCYVEKPVARNAAEARRMVDAFRADRIPLFVAYYRRALPRFLKVKQWLDEGTLGKLQSVTYRYSDGKMSKRETPLPWRLQAEHAGAGLFLDMGSHAVDLLDFWLGPLQLLSAQAQNRARIYDVEDHVEFTFRTPSGIPGSLACSFSTDPHDEFILKGDRAEARLSCFGNEPVRLLHPDGRTDSVDLPNPPHVAQPLIQTVVNDLLGAATCPSTGESALRAQLLMDQALDAYYGGREDGFWTRPWPGAQSR
jgi:predicted dehydrogenase